MKTGNFVKVKDGLKDPDYQQFDMSGWQGLIGKVFDASEGESQVIKIHWDIETLKKMPSEFVKNSIESGYEFEVMNLEAKDVQIVVDRKKDNPKEREKLILEFESKYDYADLDEDDMHLAEILGSKDIDVNEKNLKKYRTFLIENLKGRVLLDGIEDFSWEEKFVFGYGSEKEYAQLRKTRPSYKDIFKLVKILSVDEGDIDLEAKVQRQSDRKTFQIRLSKLKCIDEKSDNYALLDDFSVWVVNY